MIIRDRLDSRKIVHQRDDLESLRGADLRGEDLRYADLSRADLRGADLMGANLGGADLRVAYLGCADLFRANLRRADLRGADLGGADLRGADLRYADLRDANFEGAKLPDDIPILDRPYTQILDQIRGDGVLEMDAWHKCDTIHCLAGWLIHLCGKNGYKLEKKLGPPAAGALIHARNCPGVAVPNFGGSSEYGMQFIEDRASEEAIA